jgi:meso-butanediol dehydrogenase/(S,S)-butanediol dehydrogenase/diacetyl reductase
VAEHTAIVTGASRGIGRAVVDRLHADGGRIVSCGRGARPHDLPDDVVWVQADVSSPMQANKVVSQAHDTFGPASLLVNNAGVQIRNTVMDTTDEDWELLVGVTCRGVFYMCRGVLPQMTEHGGVIVNIGSISGNVADPSTALYNASKAFVHGLTRSIAVDHGPQVRCNAICPGWIITPMTTDSFAGAHDPTSARLDGLHRHPAGRFGDPTDIANTVAWLASSQAAFVTGQCFTIDGGMTAASPLRPELF